ncbi:hypothetical protein CRE_13084 [Caenorhabditis remanei]|uniref:glucuronosyltransferase n=1 Tax=Caenorhabditis remanei TaxID=31234 RepID=E3NBQ1_CAERE|nr:hypothetical protein CRE_13084 [Caenorhabditis remanei]
MKYTFFTPTVTRKYTKINYVRSTKNVIHLEPSEKLALIGDKFQMSDPSKFWKQDSSIYEILPMIDTFFEMFVELIKVLEENLELLDNLKEENFDVMIFENIVPPAYSVLDYLQIKTFIPSTSIAFDNSLLYSIGEPFMPSAIPFFFSVPISEFSDRMSFSERLINSISIPIMNTFLPKREFKSFRPPYSFIEMASMEPLSSFIFTNSNPYIDYPRPTLEKNDQIGGISVDIEKLRNVKVDEKWDRILNLRSKAVLISFGSFMLSKDMPLEYKKALARAMATLPEVTFIWKYESDDTISFAQGIENIHFSKWIPQTALLADSRLSAFFTHGGLGSVNEVSYLGKPTILCPIFADQMRNAKMLARHNGSIEISKYKLADSNKIEEVLRTILFDKSYRLASETLALQLANQPMKPKELLLRHAEFAARFGRLPSLDPYSRQMSFIEYFLIDIAFVGFISLLSISFVLVLITKRTFSFIRFILSSAFKRKID